jgi:hypothetical protein
MVGYVRRPLVDVCEVCLRNCLLGLVVGWLVAMWVGNLDSRRRLVYKDVFEWSLGLGK